MSDPVDLEALHAPLTPLLRLVLQQLRLNNRLNNRLNKLSVALDLACGPGHKSGWLADLVQPGGCVVGVDWDAAALQVARQRHPDPPFAWVQGDALALPLRSASVDLAWCVAALGLFADAGQALRELRRVLRPGGLVVVATGAHLWVRVRGWPADLSALLVAAYTRSLAAGGEPVAPADGLGDGLSMQLVETGFVDVQVRAFLLPSPVFSSHIAGAGVENEMLLADWSALRASVAPWLSATECERCDRFAAIEPEPELAAVLLVAAARAHL